MGKIRIDGKANLLPGRDYTGVFDKVRISRVGIAYCRIEILDGDENVRYKYDYAISFAERPVLKQLQWKVLHGKTLTDGSFWLIADWLWSDGTDKYVDKLFRL